MNMAPERRSLSALCGGKAAKGWFLVGQTFLSVRGSWAYYDPIKQSEGFPFLIFQWSVFIGPTKSFSARRLGRLDWALVPRRAGRTSPLSKRCAAVLTSFVICSNSH
jgi:hypothetical protein